MRIRPGWFFPVLSRVVLTWCSAFILLLILPWCGKAQFYHPELSWKTIETGHFLVHYHDGSERTARTVAKIAEEIYGPVTSLYNHVPDQKVSFVINDVDDISNGAAYFYDNKIELYAPSMDFIFRGTHNWLRNVVTHEFTHIVQIQTSMKFGRKIPSFYLQWLGYESERRPDVLYGYPNVIASYPISGFVVPAWFAEGVAQYNRKELRYDFWDTHRDMILRSYILADSGLTWEQMAVFGKNSHGNESSYNAGFAFVHYVAQTYGEEKLVEISRNLATLTETTIGGAIERAVGKSGEQVYNEWREALKRSYENRVAAVREHLHEGTPETYFQSKEDLLHFREAAKEQRSFSPASLLPARAMQPCCREAVETGFGNIYPRFSPDGKRYAFISTLGGDYFGSMQLCIADTPSADVRPFDVEVKAVQPGVATRMCWSPDGKKLFYARATFDHPHWSFQHDLYVFDRELKEEKRITFGRRAMSPSLSPDGTRLVCVVNRDGSTNLATMNVDGSDYKEITLYSSGEQVYDPEWSPLGDRIVFDYSIKDGRDIASIRPDGSNFEFLITGPDDSRSPTFTRDGKQIVFSSDRTGISNLYSYDFSSGRIEQITNVLGGAFMPTVGPDGGIVYSGYTSRGYKLYRLQSASAITDSNISYVAPTVHGEFGANGPLPVEGVPPGTPQSDWHALRSYDDTSVPEPASRQYKNIFTSLTVVPFLRVDNYNTKNKALDVIKPGVYLFSTDVLDKIDFFAGAALNRKLERDLFFQFNYRGKVPGLFQLGLEPTLGAEVYNVTRKAGNQLTLGVINVPVDVTYNLLEFDFVVNHPILAQFGNLELRYAHSRYTATIETFLFYPDPMIPMLVPGSDELYLIANTFSLAVNFGAIARSTTSDISPIGRKVQLRIARELNKFNGSGDYTISNGILVPNYKKINFTRVELSWREYLPFFFKRHTVAISAHGGTILEPPVDEFFDFYAGGLVGMKGYPFYSLGGNEMAILGLTYRFPIVRNIDMRFLQLYFDKLYGAFFGDIGNAWTGTLPTLRQFKTDAGAELRLESFSFYSYPTRIFFGAAYGFDQFQRKVSSTNQFVTYGKEWRFYLGVLFGFEFD